MKKVLIVDLWNGEGYSSSKAWFQRFESEAAAQKYIMDGVLIACNGIDTLMNEMDNCDEDEECPPGLIVKHDRIIYDMGEDQGSYHYKMIEEDVKVFGVVLHPNVNEYTLITDAEEWYETTKIFKELSETEDFYDGDYLGVCFDGAWDNDWDAILFDMDMLYDEKDKIFMLHHTSDLQESNTHTVYPTKDELMKAFNEVIGGDEDDIEEIYDQSEYQLYFGTRGGQERIYWEVYYKF